MRLILLFASFIYFTGFETVAYKNTGKYNIIKIN